MGIKAAGQVRRSLAVRAGVAVVVAVVVAAGLALAGTAVAPAASAKVAPAILQSLDCRSVSRCVAVGVNTPVTPGQLEGDNWNGRAWVRVPVPKPAGAVSVRLSGVNCPANHVCVAVGKAQPKSGGSYALAGVWNGTRWSVAKAAAAARPLSCSRSPARRLPAVSRSASTRRRAAAGRCLSSTGTATSGPS